jgi:hypothetical protein
MEGSTMSDGIGAWPSGATSDDWQIASNRGTTVSHTHDGGIWDDAMSAVGNQRTEADVTATDSGVICRHDKENTTLSSYYMVYCDSDGSFFKRVAGSFTNLGSVTTFTVTDRIRLDVVGTTLECFLNGVSQGTTTDSSVSTGVAGLYGGGNGASSFDNFEAYIESTSVSFYGGMNGVCGGRLFV